MEKVNRRESRSSFLPALAGEQTRRATSCAPRPGVPMKRAVRGIGICAIALLAMGQIAKYGVTVTADKKTDFTKFKTYSWITGRPSADQMIHSQVMTAVDRELMALGFTKAIEGPVDVLVTYSSLSRTDVSVKGNPDSEGRLPQYWVGTLVVALLDPESRKRRLELRIDQPIEIERVRLAATINSAVAALFAQYPTRPGK